MRGYRQQGVITVFSAVSVILIVSMILVLLEGARLGYADTLYRQQTEYGVQSFMGQYNRGLFQSYGIYGVDSRLWGNKEGILEEMCSTSSGEEGIAFLREESTAVKELKYRLLTDDGGRDFREQAVEAYINQLPKEILQEWKKEANGIKELGDENYEQTLIESAEDALEKAKELKAAGNKTTSSANVTYDNSIMERSEENPVEELKKNKESFVLSMVLPQEFQVSEGCLDRQEGMEYQELQRGTLKTEEKENLLSEVIFPMYLGSHYSSALETKEGNFSYEQEYLLIGKGTDRENLEGVVKKLITIRELSWFAYRLTDEESRQKATAAATALMGAVNLPALIKPVEMGILLAWSYEDGIKDVKTLMEGGKVPLIPGQGQENAKQFSYKDFLLLLMLIEEKDTLTYRAMDIVEEKLKEEGIAFEANKTITGIEGTIQFETSNLFSFQDYYMKRTYSVRKLYE